VHERRREEVTRERKKWKSRAAPTARAEQIQVVESAKGVIGRSA
jgi:hypothetical protein